MHGQIFVGDVEVTCVTDAEGPFPIKLPALFPGVRSEQWQLHRRDYPEAFADAETFHVHIACYVLRTNKRTVLVDTGVGPAPAPFFGDMRGDLIHGLSLADVKPESVDTVFMTHGHPDHVGWNLFDGNPSFPNARYILSETDWNAFQDPAVQAALPFQYVDQTLTPLKALGMLDQIDGETVLSDEITAIPAPGHTPGHMVVSISSRGQRAMILGDVLIHPAQVAEPDWGSIFDMDPDQATATRKKLLGRLEMEAMTAAQCHLPHPGFGLVMRVEGRRHWQPLERN